jgi:hypothetical protein
MLKAITILASCAALWVWLVEYLAPMAGAPW